MTDSPMLDVEAVAKILNISTKQVYRLLNNRKLAHIRIGRVIRIRRVDLERYIQGLLVTESTPV